jgi:uncharacterized membrane protein YedE/YeeE
MNLIEFISQPWHWSISGAMIVVVMFLLLYLGQKFGVSSSFEAICSFGGAGNKIKYFNFDWKKQDWQLVFLAGAVIGGGIASTLLASPEPVQVSVATVTDLQSIGVIAPQVTENAGAGFLPLELFNFESLLTLKGIILMVGGGFLIGFGTRWAGGCTSGHAISGLANLQVPSLIAVIGFFIGGLLMTHFLLPIILSF